MSVYFIREDCPGGFFKIGTTDGDPFTVACHDLFRQGRDPATQIHGELESVR